MRVLHGKDVVHLGRTELCEIVAGYDRVVVDVGAGDGRFATAYAREHPETLVVGLDIAKDKLAEAARRAGRKPQRGGVPNLLYVVASAEESPTELAGRASEVHVVLPWGRLLRGCLPATTSWRVSPAWPHRGRSSR
jgi:16S rRNA (adenine(1408)-N(1))-methyltransferase